MGVSVRLSRNARAYLPFWLAIPLYFFVGAVWLVVGAVWVIVWLIVQRCTLAGRGAARRREHRAAREAQRPEAIAAEQALVEEYQRQREEGLRQRENAIDAELEEYRQQLQDHDARTHRYRVTECNIDALKGGEFTLEAEGLDQVHIRLDAKSVTHFLSLKAGDIVQVTLAPGDAGLEEFWHICRASGAKPRSPVKPTATDMEWLGLTANRSEPGG